MKRFFLLIVFALAIGQTPAIAQSSLGGGLVFGSDAEALGLDIRYLYEFEKKWRGQVNIDYFLVDDPLVWWTLDVNANYIFTNSRKLIGYAIGGLDFTTAGVDDFTRTKLSINLGAGIEGAMSWGGLYGEIKAILGSFDQFVIGGGVRFPLN